MSINTYTETRDEVNSQLYDMIMARPVSNDDLKEFCACLGEYLIARGVHLEQYPHITIESFRAKYTKGLSNLEQFQKDLTDLVFVLSQLWDREDKLLQAANSDANVTPLTTKKRLGR